MFYGSVIAGTKRNAILVARRVTLAFQGGAYGYCKIHSGRGCQGYVTVLLPAVLTEECVRGHRPVARLAARYLMTRG